MFSECSSLKELNIMNFNFESLNDMSYMFNKCSSLTDLEIPKINNDIDVDYLFSDCNEKLKSNMAKNNLNKSAFNDESKKKYIKPDYEDTMPGGIEIGNADANEIENENNV